MNTTLCTIFSGAVLPVTVRSAAPATNRAENEIICAAKVGAQNGPFVLVDAVQREHRLGRVDSYALVGHGRLRSWFLTAQFWHSMPWGRPPQQF